MVGKIFFCVSHSCSSEYSLAQIQTLKVWRPDFLCDSCISPKEPEFADFQGISQTYLLNSGFLECQAFLQIRKNSFCSTTANAF